MCYFFYFDDEDEDEFIDEEELQNILKKIYFNMQFVINIIEIVKKFSIYLDF